VRIKIGKIDSRVIPDLTGSAEIELNSETNTLLAPREAVFQEKRQSMVFLQGPEVAEIRKPVEWAWRTSRPWPSVPASRKGT